MPLSVAERKRRSRASNPEACQNEKEKSRERMAIYRSKNKAQKKAGDYKSLLNNNEKKDLEAQSANHRLSVLGDWLVAHGLDFAPDAVIERNIVNLFVPKIEMHKIERVVAEFEITVAQKILCTRSLTPTGEVASGGAVGCEAGGMAPTKPKTTGTIRYGPLGITVKKEGSSPGCDQPPPPPTPDIATIVSRALGKDEALKVDPSTRKESIDGRPRKSTHRLIKRHNGPGQETQDGKESTNGRPKTPTLRLMKRHEGPGQATEDGKESTASRPISSMHHQIGRAHV